MSIHEQFMNRALELADLASALGEVPVGAVIVMDGEVIAEAYNRRELDHNCLSHAELIAINDASQRLGRWRLTGATVYVTLEPCIMCAGALVHARVDHLVYGAADAKFGGVESLYCIANDPRLNHRMTVTKGIMADRSVQKLKQFFLSLRG